MTNDQDNARWQDLAKQLGLDGSAPMPSIVVPRTQPADTVPEPAADDESPGIGEASNDADAERGEAEPNKRRRGRRGRKRGPNGDASKPDARGEGNKDATERGGRRRKSRYGTDAPARGIAVEDSRAERVPADDDDEDTAKLSEWNIPTWTDLIDSLYRPDR